jgi:RHS repeat-associated protein
MTGDETGRQFVYDAWNRMVEVKNSGGTSLKTFEFDGLTRRISETASGTTRDLYYSAQWQVLEEAVSGNTQVRYVWSPVYVDALVLRDRDTNSDGSLDERLYVVQDANFNVVALLDTSGNVVERYTYSPFGVQTVYDASYTVRGGGSTYSFTHGFQGLRYDATSGLNYTHTRPYSPTLARFTGLDWILFEGRDVNLYRAFANKPIDALDPLGTDVITVNTKEYEKYEVTTLTATLTNSPGFKWNNGQVAIIKKALAKAYITVRDAALATELFYNSRCTKRHVETREERLTNDATAGRIATFFNAKDGDASCSCIKRVLDTLWRIERTIFGSGLPKSPMLKIHHEDANLDYMGSAIKGRNGDTLNVHAGFWHFKNGQTQSLRNQVGTVIHELSHAVAATDDYDAYYVSGSGATAVYTTDREPLGANNKQTILTGKQKCTNASSIEYYAMEWYK